MTDLFALDGPRFGPASGAFRYLIHVSATGGLSAQRTTSHPALVLRGLRPGAAISVSVRGVNIRGTGDSARLRRQKRDQNDGYTARS